jgi:hypothetical protein
VLTLGANSRVPNSSGVASGEATADGGR